MSIFNAVDSVFFLNIYSLNSSSSNWENKVFFMAYCMIYVIWFGIK